MEDNDIIIEKYLENYPKPISLKSTKNIIEQMENNVCKIKLLDGSKGTGFLCKIPYYNIEILITNNHVINKEILDKEGKILISLNNNKKEIELKNRKYYTNKEYDITMIEMKVKDGINNYLE